MTIRNRIRMWVVDQPLTVSLGQVKGSDKGSDYYQRVSQTGGRETDMSPLFPPAKDQKKQLKHQAASKHKFLHCLDWWVSVIIFYRLKCLHWAKPVKAGSCTPAAPLSLVSPCLTPSWYLAAGLRKPGRISILLGNLPASVSSLLSLPFFF